MYIRNGIQANGENSSTTHSGFKFGIPYNTEPDAKPACGIGNIRGGDVIYLSFGMMNYYDPNTRKHNFICTKHYSTVQISPVAILCAGDVFVFCTGGHVYNAGIYALIAKSKNYALNEIIPESDITVTKLA